MPRDELAQAVRDAVGRRGERATGEPVPDVSVLDLLNREITKIVERPDIKAAWAKQGATAMTMSAPQFKVFMQDQVAKWAKVIADNHIRHIN